MPSVAFIFGGEEGSSWYRAHYPSQLLQAEGWDAYLTPTAYFEDDADAIHPIIDGAVQSPPDVIVLGGVPGTGVASCITKARKSGQKVLYDCDDWIFGAPPYNRGFQDGNTRHDNGKVRKQIIRECMAAADAVLCSTDYLAERIGRFTRSIVAPNVFPDVEEIDWNPYSSDHLRIGWTGGLEVHSHDLLVLRGFIGPFVLKHDARIVHIGADPGHEWGSFAGLADVPDDHVEEVPRTTFEGFWKALGDANLDFALVPLEMIPFNQAKTATKGTEYALCGIPFLASPVQAYRLWYPAAAVTHWSPALEEMRRIYVRVRENFRLNAVRNVELWREQWIQGFETAIH